MSATRFFGTQLPSGLRVAVEEIPSALSAAVGYFVETGVRHETADVLGVSHFLEHMSFKATKKRSALEVNLALDTMGSLANAYTSCERTVYHAQVLPEFMPDAISLIAEMIDPAFLQSDFDCEKQVIIEEIEMYNDRPESLLFDEALRLRFAPHPIGARILGSKESIANLSLEMMKNYHADRYHPSRIILAVAGNVRHEDVFEYAKRAPLPAGNPKPSSPGDAKPEGKRGAGSIVRKDDVTEQYLAIWNGPSMKEHRALYVAGMLGILLGDAEGSRLSWAMTHTGLAQNAEAGSVSFTDVGMLYACFSSIPESFDACLETLHGELRGLRARPPGEDEFARAQTKFAARTVMSSESTNGRMMSVGMDVLTGQPHMSLDEELALIMSITLDEIRAVAESFGAPDVEAAIGPMTVERLSPR